MECLLDGFHKNIEIKKKEFVIIQQIFWNLEEISQKFDKNAVNHMNHILNYLWSGLVQAAGLRT